MKRHVLTRTSRPLPGLSEAPHKVTFQFTKYILLRPERQGRTNSLLTGRRDSHDGCISPSRVTLEHCSLRARVPKAPKSTNQSDKTELSQCVFFETENRYSACLSVFPSYFLLFPHSYLSSVLCILLPSSLLKICPPLPFCPFFLPSPHSSQNPSTLLSSSFTHLYFVPVSCSLSFLPSFLLPLSPFLFPS